MTQHIYSKPRKSLCTHLLCHPKVVSCYCQTLHCVFLTQSLVLALMKDNVPFSWKHFQSSRVKPVSLILYQTSNTILRDESLDDCGTSKCWCKDRGQGVGFSSPSMVLSYFLVVHESCNMFLGFSSLCRVQMHTPWLSLGHYQEGEEWSWAPSLPSSQLPKPAVLVISHHYKIVWNVFGFMPRTGVGSAQHRQNKTLTFAILFS